MEAKLKLNDRELATLILDKRTCMQKTVMKTQNDWIKSEKALSKYYIEFFCNCRAFDRLKKANNDQILPDDNENYGENDFEEVVSDCDDLIEFDHDNENTVNLNVRSEQELRESDKIEAKQEFGKVIKNWRGLKIPWKKLFTQEVLGLEKESDKVHPYKHLSNVPVDEMMKFISGRDVDNLFGYLPMMCKNSKCQLGTLSSQSFVERMNSEANNVITVERTQLDDSILEKCVVLRMNKDFMKLMARKSYINFVKFKSLEE